MKEFDFEQLKNIEIEFPDSWVENALNSPEEKRKFIIPKRFYYITASAAAFVIIVAAVTLTLLLGIGKDVDLIAPSPDPSQADSISGGVTPGKTNGSLPPETPPLTSGAGDQNTTSVTEPSENSDKRENGNSKQKQKSSNQTANNKLSSGSKKPSNGSKQKSAPSDSTKPNENEPATEPRVTEEITDMPIDPTTEDDGLEVDYCSISVKLDKSYKDSIIYCRIEKPDGTVVGSRDLFDNSRIASLDTLAPASEGESDTVYFNYDPVNSGGLVFYYDKPYNVVVYNSNGEIIKKKTIVFDYDEFDYYF